VWKSDRSFATCSMSFSLGRMVVLQHRCRKDPHLHRATHFISMHSRAAALQLCIRGTSVHSSTLQTQDVPEVVGAICLLEAAARHRHNTLHSADEGRVMMRASGGTAATDRVRTRNRCRQKDEAHLLLEQGAAVQEVGRLALILGCLHRLFG
jgi:hypothetical protein